jgi:N-acetyl sugar amidotransferase
MTDKEYQAVCTRCVMNSSDPEIQFDAAGVCSHCIEFDTLTKKSWFPNDEGKRKLGAILAKVKAEGKNREYDCIIGLSGGIDSSYLALVLKDYGLKPLVVHVDAGWNSELAVYNIEQVIKYCDFDLYTHVMDWEEIRRLQLSYLKSGVANQDTIQDHAFFASLYHFAVKNNINYVISGGNVATESVSARAWHHSAMDAINIKSIYAKFDGKSLKQYKTISFFSYYFYYPFVKQMKTIRPLNFMPYDTDDALKVLKDKVGYKEYGRKHGESRFTKFFQNYYLPEKFGIDKRIIHLSSKILSEQISRAKALDELKAPLYDDVELQSDKEYIAKKLRISVDVLDSYIKSPGCYYSEYNNWDSRYHCVKWLQAKFSTLIGRKITNYS